MLTYTLYADDYGGGGDVTHYWEGVNLKNDALFVPGDPAAARLNTAIQDGKSVILRLEDLALPPEDPAAKLLRAARHVFGLPATVHSYISSEGDQALNPHTDPYDTVLLQLSGAKEWTTCVPITKAAIANETSRLLSDADRCQLHEVRTDHARGCTAFTDGALRRMECQHFTLSSGDMLYMPKGVVHVARNEPNIVGRTSEHVTLGLLREGRQWTDLWQSLSISVKAAHALDRNPDDFSTAQVVVGRSLDAVSSSFRTVGGVEFLGALPLWSAASKSANQLTASDVVASPAFSGAYERLVIRTFRVMSSELATAALTTYAKPKEVKQLKSAILQYLIAPVTIESVVAAMLKRAERKDLRSLQRSVSACTTFV